VLLLQAFIVSSVARLLGLLASAFDPPQQASFRAGIAAAAAPIGIKESQVTITSFADVVSDRRLRSLLQGAEAPISELEVAFEITRVLTEAAAAEVSNAVADAAMLPQSNTTLLAILLQKSGLKITELHLVKAPEAIRVEGINNTTDEASPDATKRSNALLLPIVIGALTPCIS
jgi:hypothetical protein